jgi:hypothetical protein
MNTYEGYWVEVSGQLHASAALLLVPIVWKVGGPQSKSGSYRKEKNLLLPPRIESRLLGHSARKLVVMPTELSQIPLVIVIEQKSEAYMSFIHVTTFCWLL